MSIQVKIVFTQILGAFFGLIGLSILAFSIFKEKDLTMGQNVVLILVTSFGMVSAFPKAASVVVNGAERLIPWGKKKKEDG